MYKFNLQLFAGEDMVDAEQFGFTEEDLKGFIPEEKPDEKPVESIEDKPNETVETEHEETETAPDGDNKESVPEDHADNLKAALKEERARRKALRDELDALKAQYSQQPIQQPQQPQTPDIMQDIKKQARAKAIESLKIEGNPSDLMFADPDKYEDFVAERTRLEYEAVTKYQEQQRVYSENVNFVNELRQIPDFPTVFKYAEEELGEMPLRKARKIEDAYIRIDHGQGTKDDFATIRDFALECQKKMTGANTNVTPQAQPQQTTESISDKLDQAAQLPKATQLGGTKTAQMSWAEVERLAKAEKWDEIPKEMLLKLDPTGELLK